MSAPVWPSTLPQSFLRDGYGEEGANNVLRSENSVGPAKTRRRTTANVWPINGGMRMTDTQFAAFKTFLKDSAADRATPFSFPDPHGGSALLVRMTNPYKLSAMGVDWRVDFDLEVLP